MTGVALLVERERGRLRTLVALSGVAVAAGAIAIALLLGVALLGGARWIALPRGLPLAIWAIALGLATLVALSTRRRLTSATSSTVVAAAIEREAAMRAGAVRAVLEIGDSSSLGRRASELLGAQLATRGAVLAPALRAGAARRWRALGAAAAVAVVSLGASRGAWPDGWRALAHPVGAWRGTLLPAIRVDAPTAVVRGERARVTIEADGRRDVELWTRATGAGWRTTAVALRDGRASFALPPAEADLQLVARDSRGSSDTVHVKLAERPFVGDVALRAEYPAYLGRSAEPLALGEVARVPRGTTITIAGRASTALRRVVLAREADTIALRADGQRFGGQLQPSASGRWIWLAEGASGAIADLPAPLDVDVLPDSAPVAEILAPGRDSIVSASGHVVLSLGASDDHGLGALGLESWTEPAAGPRGEVTRQALPAAGAPRWRGDVGFELAERALQPGDRLHVVLVAVDASPWRQTTRSRELVLRVPGLAEQRTLARQAADSAATGAATLAAAQKQLQQRTGDAARARGERVTAREGAQGGASAHRSAETQSFEAAEKSKSLAKEQRQLADKVQALAEQAKTLERRLREAGALDSALAARLREVQQLLHDALTPELAEQLRKVEEAARGQQADESRRALADLAAAQQRTREQLDRSVEMLRRAALEGAMQTLRDEARDIAKSEQAIADSGRSGATPPQSAQALGDRARSLAGDVSELSKRLARERAETGAQKTAAAATHAGRSADQMQQAASAEDKSNSRQAGSSASAESAAREMQQAAQQLSDAREAQVGEWKSELTKELDQSIQEMLAMARQEDALAQQAQAGADPSGTRAEQSAVEQGVNKASERLQAAGQKSSLVSPRSQRAVNDAKQRVQQATSQAAASTQGQQSGSQAGSSMRDAASALNQAAASLVRDRERVNGASSASGFSEMLQELQELAKRQGALNAQSSGMSLGLTGKPSPQGTGIGQPGGGAAGDTRTLARQQRGVAESLDELGDGDASGRTSAMAKEARELAKALERGVADPSTLERQQRLYRRLLDAGRSMEQDERDDASKRESRSATGTATFTPGTENAASRPASKFREPAWSDLRGLTPEERRLVIDYFKRLNAEP